MRAQAWILMCAVSGCGVAATKRDVSRADIAYPERTRLTGYLADYTGWHEDTPGQVPRTAVLDEAVLESDGRRECAVLTMRTALEGDPEWSPGLSGRRNGRGHRLHDSRRARRG